MTSLPVPISALFRILVEGDAAPAASLDHDSWKELLAFADRTQLTLYLRRVPGLPAWLEAEIENRRVKNLKRRDRLRSQFAEVSRALSAADVDFVLLKGFTHEIAFGIDGEVRVQHDLDILCEPSAMGRAYGALQANGYVPHGDRPLSTEHDKPLVRPHSWRWRGDYYDPDMPIPVELHDSIWDSSHDRLNVDGSAFWPRRRVVEIDGLRIPALSEPDLVGFAALHLLRHALRNDARPAHAFELAQFLRHRAEDALFWSRWRESHDSGLRALESAGFRFAQEWFGAPQGPPLEARVEAPRVESWFREFAWSPIVNLMRPNKDVLWLHLALLNRRWDRARVVCHRLTPFRLPHSEADFFDRLRYHAGALAPALLSGVRWWWRRETVSKASQISDWKRRSV